MDQLKLIKKTQTDGHQVTVGKYRFGEQPLIIAGPCAVENKYQIEATASAVKKIGADMLRGGAFKPRTSPYSFQGLGLPGLKMLKEAGRKNNLPVVTEVIDPRDVPWVADYADILQIGARNMHNFSLLCEVGKSKKPVILKRSMYATMKEFLSSAEYILAAGNRNVILCERGIRTFETYTRNTLDLSTVPGIKGLSGLPVIVDPSHGTGKPEIIPAMSAAALAAGADGVIIEVHINPEQALSDKKQQLTPDKFHELMRFLQKRVPATGITPKQHNGGTL